MSDIAELYRRATDQFGSRVAKIRDDQWSEPTPCTEWDVRALVHHLVYEVIWVAPLLRGETIAEIGDRFEGDILGDDPKAAWNEASAAALAAAAEPGAFSRTVDLSRGPTPAEEYAWEMILDQAVHGWDLARGIGDDDTMDPDLTARIWERFNPKFVELRATGAFGSEVQVPEDADVQTKLLAALGRRR